MIVLDAPAKLTWFLEVTGRRADGYHELRSEMVSLAFGDTLEVDEMADYLEIEGAPHLAADETNLVSRALALVGRRAGVRVIKRIPTGGGLGGGSADAAAILRWAGGDAAAALSLGADVPFCLVGGRALVEGVGERVTPLAFEARRVTLLLSEVGIDTTRVFHAYDELVARGVRPTGRNHLEAAATLVEPRLARVLAWARERFGEVTLAGSGSTMFVDSHVDPERQTWREKGPVGPVRVVQTTTTPKAPTTYLPAARR
ncbi:MAG: 4-(cytidine 5'-diphospho)-2-C-methyl-D-erythritol kinase [Acidimicrobiales bacterium]